MRALLIALAAIALFLQDPTCLAAEQPADSGGPCVDVRVGDEHAFNLDCLNQQLRRSAEQEHETQVLAAPVGAGSPSTELGLANQAAAEEKMGAAFGKSAEPQRPRPTFASPILTQQVSH